MRTIWKFPLLENGSCLSLTMPVGARVVHVDHQANLGLCLWAEVDPGAAETERAFEVFGTGRPIPDGAVHVHTWQSPPFVWHLYETTP